MSLRQRTQTVWLTNYDMIAVETVWEVERRAYWRERLHRLLAIVLHLNGIDVDCYGAGNMRKWKHVFLTIGVKRHEHVISLLFFRFELSFVRWRWRVWPLWWRHQRQHSVRIIIICLSQVFKRNIQRDACDDKWMCDACITITYAVRMWGKRYRDKQTDAQLNGWRSKRSIFRLYAKS